jgi:two-component system, NtrC family, sensor histidine kinase KinB
VAQAGRLGHGGEGGIATVTLRQRLLLTLAPSLLLLAVLGGAGIFLLYRVSGLIDLILRENYESVVAMTGLNEALERIDSSFLLATTGDESAQASYEHNWKEFQRHLEAQKRNVTILPREQILTDELVEQAAGYREAGDAFWKLEADRRKVAYRGSPARPGLFGRFQQIKLLAAEIRELNQRNMESASRKARRTAREAIGWFVAGLVVSVALAVLLGWWTTRAILRPIQDVTASATAVGLGDLDQVISVSSRDELGELAEAFNRMARQLRDYRRTALARLLRAQRTSQATIDSFPDPVLVIDPAGQVEMANPAARRLFGLPTPPAEQTGPLPAWSPPPSLADAVREAIERQRPYLGESFEQIVTFQQAGQDRAYLPQILPIHDPYGGTMGAAVVLDDVTRFRLLDQVKSDLLATVSHELKTPLTAVRLVLHLLLEETVGPLTAKQSELLIDARDNAERLLRMIESLLALARLEQARDAFQIGPQAPADVLRTAADQARPRAEDGHVELVVEEATELPPIAVDSARLSQALNNLLDNALTYTPAGGRITLRAARAGPDRVRLSVSDTGPGIPPAHLPHVFERFFRVPGQSAASGTGLGLAIVRELITAMGGGASCESRPGHGATFHLDLPLWRSPE